MAKSSTVEKLSGLKRRVEVEVAADKVTAAYGQRVNKVAQSAKIDGFRQGKVPQKVIEQRFGKNILLEVAEELMREHFISAVEEHKLRIAGNPQIIPREIKQGAPLQYSIEFEVYPEIELADLSQVNMTRERVELTEQDIDNMLDVLRKQQAEWVAVERAAQVGDQVSIDFEGKIDGVPFERGAAQGFTLELGAKQMIPGFEDAIVGKNPGDSFVITCRFPETYSQADLAGKEATFDTTLHKVMEPKLPELNDEFAKRVGLEGGMDALRAEVRKNMQRQVDQMMQDRFKRQVLDKLLELNKIELPEGLIDAEMEHMQETALARFGENAKNMDKEKLFPAEQFKPHAVERVTLGLILGEVIKKYELSTDDAKVKAKIQEIAAVYGQPEQVEAWYYSNERMLSEVKAVVLEMQAVDKLAEQMHIEEQVISYEQATKSGQPTS